MSDDGPLPAGAPWLVCHTRPRCEKKFSALLTAEHFEHYLPLISSVRRYQTRTKRFTKPLFPGYVFACVPPAEKARIYQQDLLARTITVTDVPRFLRQLDEVRAVIAAGFELSLVPLLTKGRRVRVVGGPLHGVEGTVDHAGDPRGVVIAVDVLRQGLLVRVPLENLKLEP